MNNNNFQSKVKNPLEETSNFTGSKKFQQMDSTTFLSSSPVQNIFFNTSFDKNHLKSVIAWFLEHYGEKLTVDLVETLKQVGFHQATLAGVSLGVDDLQIPPQKDVLLSQSSIKMTHVNHSLETGNLTSVEKSQRLIDTWNKTSETLRQSAVHNFRTTNPINPVYMMAFSGARGNISQVRQLVAMRGLMADPQGAILEFPIQSNFREGLTVTEYLISCYGARKGLVDTALRTATSGYLTRRLVDAVQHVVVHVTNCQTKKGIIIKEKNIEQRLIGRVLLDDIVLDSKTVIKKDTLISPRLAKKIAGQHIPIRVRSPLTCQTEKSVCQLCYGVDLAQGKLVSLGEAVGIIAAQSIGEPGTQLTMRTFHTGGVGVFSDQAMKTFTAPFEGKVEFVGSLPGLFVRTPHGNIVYLLKHKLLNQDKIFLKLIASKVTQKPLVYEIKHGDVPAGSLLWVKQGEVVKTGQLLLQASRLQRSRQEMPESSHPVRASLSGEVFFQFIKTRTVEEEKRLPLKTKKKKQQTRPLLQPNQKEISPTIPTLVELGNFWVFSSFVQPETQISSSFLIKGDLLSPETPVQEYSFLIPERGQLKTVNSNVVFANTGIGFLFSKINYSGLFYFLNTSTNNLFSYTTNSTFSKFTWYPIFKKLESFSSGYCLKLSFEDNGSLYKNSELNEKITEKSTSFDQSVRSYLWSPTQVFSLITSSKWPVIKNSFPYCFFVTGQNQTFSKTGMFQIKLNSNRFWTLKHTFKINFLLNNSKARSNFFVSFPNFSKTKVFEKSGQPENTISQVSSFSKFFFEDKTFSRKKNLSGIVNKNQNERKSFDFLSQALNLVHKTLQIETQTKLIEKKQSWFYLPKNSLGKFGCSKLTGVVLEPGKMFEDLCFQNFSISMNLLSNDTFFLLKSKRKVDVHAHYLKQIEIFQNPFVVEKPYFSIDSTQKFKIGAVAPEPTLLFFVRQDSSNFCFYKKNKKQNKVFVNIPFGAKRLKQNSVQDNPDLPGFNTFFKKRDLLFKTSTLSKPKISFWHQNEGQKFRPMEFEIKKKRRLSHIIFFQKLSHQVIPDKKFFYETWLSQNHSSMDICINSPLFTKQVKTVFKKTPIKKWKFEVLTPLNSEWISMSKFLKVDIEISTPKTFGKLEEFQHKFFLSNNQKLISKNRFNTDFPIKFSNQFRVSGLNVMFYRKIILENAKNFSFQSFQGGWVVPEYSLTRAFVKAKKVGEFSRIQTKQKNSCLGIIRTQDLVSLAFLNQHKLMFSTKIGRRIRWGQEIVPGFASSLSGQIIKATENRLVFRKGIPLLASVRGLLHITHKDLIQKNDLLITLRSRRLQTEDIVQGIPKIEQLFEARETQGGEIIKNNMHMLLNKFFSLARQIKPVPEAVELSLTYIQKFLVENILQAYSNQGVHIAEKHVEVVVRQMTARVRITHGGDSGFLPGEFVQIRVIEKINHGLLTRGRRQAAYEPVILGITKSVLQSESFLLAASFQQVSKVLVRSALAKKTDFLRGLHENILVGQPIPAGTGIINLTHYPKNWQESLESEISIRRTTSSFLQPNQKE